MTRGDSRTGPAWVAALTVLVAAAPGSAAAQDALARERAEFTRWLMTSPVSPAAAVAHRPVGTGVTLGPAGADVPVAGIPPGRLAAERGGVVLEEDGRRRPLPHGRPVRLGDRILVVGGPREAPWVTLFDSASARKPTAFYPAAQGLSFVGPLEPAARPATVRLLTLDGVEVEATEAGRVRVPLGRGTATLAVRRVPDPATGEAELEVYFQDETNGDGTYLAGRFVTLDPLPDGRYRLDFNRARNPFCAYSTAFPCPVPWPGNRVAARLEAGERYAGGGLDAPAPRP